MSDFSHISVEISLPKLRFDGHRAGLQVVGEMLSTIKRAQTCNVFPSL